MGRPKRTRKDANHNEILTQLREDGCIVVDVADLANKGDPEKNYGHPLDAFVLPPNGEGWIQVEIKADAMSPFTDEEIKYLDRLNLWPPPTFSNDPIVVIRSAEDFWAAVNHYRASRS